MAITRKALAASREQRAWELSIRGLTQMQIAERLTREGLGPISQQAVSAALQRVADRCASDLTTRVLEHKARQLAALTHIYNEAMRAWHRSKRGERQITGKVHASPPPAQAPPAGPPAASPLAVRQGQQPSDYTITVLREQCGGSEYLKRAESALASIRKLLGLDAPTRTEVAGTIVGGVDGGGVVVYIPHNGRDPLPETAATELPPGPGGLEADQSTIRRK